MSDPTAEKSDVELKREQLLKAYLTGEQAKVAELARKKNPSLKQRMFGDMGKSIRSLVEKF